MLIEVNVVGDLYKLYVKCPMCGHKSSFVVRGAKHYKRVTDFLGGKGYAQDLDFLSVDDRELLISGLCNACWDRMEEDEEC